MSKQPKKLASDAASELSKRGAKKGGIARANTLTPEERREIARAAVRKRWERAGKLKSPEPVDGEYEDPDSSEPVAQEAPYSLFAGKLELGDAVLECYVLSDLRRVVSQSQVVKALSGGRDSGNLGRYLRANPLYDGYSFAGPIQFKIPGNPTLAKGMEASQFVELCDLYIEAAEQGLLRPNQLPLAKRSQAFVRACAKVGIIALVDEATGYQQVRAKRALQLKLQAFIADEIQEWARMFPESFWLQLARLEGINYSARSRPLRWGKYVMMFVYDAIDGDVGSELRKKNPNPRFLKNHHQWLKKFGRDKVHDQITAVVALMKSCNNMDEFRKTFAKVFRQSPSEQMTFDDLLVS